MRASDLRADTGTLFFLDRIQTQHSQTYLHKEKLFFVKGMLTSPLVTACVSDDAAQELNGANENSPGAAMKTLLVPRMRHWCQTPRRWTCLSRLLEQANGCVICCMNVCFHTETKKELSSCYWTKLQKHVVLRDKTGKFFDKCHRHRAIRAMVPRRRPSPHCSPMSGSHHRQNRLST